MLPLALTGCSILGLLMTPLQLLFSLFSSVGSGLGSLTGLASIEPLEGPPPELRQLPDGTWSVAGIEPGARFEIVFEAPGHTERRLRWPEDLADLPRDDVGRVPIDVVLEPVAARDDG